MARNIIIRPVISEKSDKLSAKRNQYSFVVEKSANKLEIAKAFSVLYPEVTVKSINTMISPSKAKSRNTRSGLVKGRVSPYKKALITLGDGDNLEIFGSEN